MPEAKNNFNGAKMDKSSDSRVIEKGNYRDALNFRVSNSEGSDNGAGENSLSNKKLTNFSLGANPFTLGMYGDEFEEKMYWFVKSDTANHVIEWDNINQVSSIVLKDTRVGVLNILNFSEDNLITGVNVLIDSDTGERFLLWTDGLNDPRQINIERAKGYGENGFEAKHINTYKAPPIYPPVIELTNTADDEENNLEEKFVAFAYRYKYLDGEYSASSPFTEYAFYPKDFEFDFSTSSNEGMINRFSAVNVVFNTGDELVSDIEVIFKESNSITLYSVESFNKTYKGWGDNTEVQFLYANTKIYKVLPETEINRLYDNVPLKAYTQDLVGNRVIYGNYTDNMNIVDCDGEEIVIDIELSKDATANVAPSVVSTMRSNRDYEAGIAYVYENGRITTPLTSEGNTIYVPNSDSANQNKLKVKVTNLAPCGATQYRFFIKQSKTDYDTIVPVLFFQDGTDVWVKLEGNEASKINEGDFVFVKSDTTGLLSSLRQTRILEIKNQPKNFLELPTETALIQPSGNYFRIKPIDFRMNVDDYETYEWSGYDNSRDRYDQPIRFNISYVEDAIGYGLTVSDDMTRFSPQTTYTGLVDIRYRIEIDGTTPDTFKWSKDDGANWEVENIVIDGLEQTLEEGISIIFGSTTGHFTDDYWILSAKSASDNNFGNDMESRAYGIYKGIEAEDTESGDLDIIEGGASIIFRYDEHGAASEFYEEPFYSSRRYANIEEWWYGDNIADKVLLSEDRIYFRRGELGKDGNADFIVIDPTFQMNMIVRSSGEQSNEVTGTRAAINTYWSVFQSENVLIFETRPLDLNLDIFYEVGRTYDISTEGYHLGFDVNDVSQTASVSADLILPLFNAFSWGNGFESFKIKDSFLGKKMYIDTRPSSPIEDYRENNRIASLTYSGIYEQTTNINRLNEFNLSLINYKDMDDEYGAINKVYGRETDIIVFQEDKIHKVLQNKSVIYNADGTGNITQSLAVLGQEVAFKGEHGMSNHPESFAAYGMNLWFTDAKRGAVLQIGEDERIREVSKLGMEDYFRDDFIINLDGLKKGGYDPYFDEYVLSIGDQPVAETLVVSCGGNIFKTLQVNPFTYILKLNTLSGDVDVVYDIASGSANITATFNSNPYTTGTVTGSGTLSFTRDTLVEDEVTIVVTPVTTPIEYSISHVCPLGATMEVVSIIINGIEDDGLTMTSRYKWDNSAFFSKVPVFELDGITLFESEIGVESTGKFPVEGADIEIQAYKDYINSGDFTKAEANSLSYLVSNTTYTELDIATIQSLATYPTITTLNEGGVPQTDKANFTFTRPIGTEKLYLIWDYTSLSINRDTYIYIFFDASGSMDSTLTPLEEMRDTLLQDALLPFYDNDVDLYNSRVVIINDATERPIEMLNAIGNEPVGNIISLVFADEAQPPYHDTSFDDSETTLDYETDIATFRARLASFDPSYYRGTIFQVSGIGDQFTSYKAFLEAVEAGTGSYAGSGGLSDKTEVLFKYDIIDGDTAAYYLTLVTDALTEHGFDLTP